VVLNRGGTPPKGGVNKFPGVHEPYALYNMESLIKNLPINTFVFATYLESGDLKQRTINWGRRGREKYKNHCTRHFVHVRSL